MKHKPNLSLDLDSWTTRQTPIGHLAVIMRYTTLRSSSTRDLSGYSRQAAPDLEGPRATQAHTDLLL